MRIEIGGTLVISLLLSIDSAVIAQPNTDQIAVAVANKAHIDPKALQGLKLAGVVLGCTGVELLIADCSFERSEPVLVRSARHVDGPGNPRCGPGRFGFGCHVSDDPSAGPRTRSP